MQEKKKGAVGVEVQKSLGWGSPQVLGSELVYLYNLSESGCCGVESGTETSESEQYWAILEIQSNQGTGLLTPFFYSEDQVKIPEMPYLLYTH